jgi:hypothetical protein
MLDSPIRNHESLREEDMRGGGDGELERRRRNSFALVLRERKDKFCEDVLSQNHINISFACNYHYALP